MKAFLKVSLSHIRDSHNYILFLVFKLCNESISDLLYQLCTNADSFSRDRIQLMITWLQNLRKISITNPFISTSKQMINPNSGKIFDKVCID